MRRRSDGAWVIGANGNIIMTFLHLDYEPDSGDLFGVGKIQFFITVTDA